MMRGDRGIDQIAAQRPQPRQRAFLVHARLAGCNRRHRRPGSPLFSGFRSIAYPQAGETLPQKSVMAAGTSRLLRHPQHPRATDHLLFESGDVTKFADRANACGRLEFHPSRVHRARLAPSVPRARAPQPEPSRSSRNQGWLPRTFPTTPRSPRSVLPVTLRCPAPDALRRLTDRKGLSARRDEHSPFR